MADIKFVLEHDWYVHAHNTPTSLADILQRRVLVTHDTGQLEELRDDLDRTAKLLAHYLEFMLEKGMVTPEEVCAIVNRTSGHKIVVAEVKDGEAC